MYERYVFVCDIREGKQPTSYHSRICMTGAAKIWKSELQLDSEDVVKPTRIARLKHHIECYGSKHLRT